MLDKEQDRRGRDSGIGADEIAADSSCCGMSRTEPVMISGASPKELQVDEVRCLAGAMASGTSSTVWTSSGRAC